MVAVWLPFVNGNWFVSSAGEADFLSTLPHRLLLFGICVAGCIAVWKKRELLDLDLFLIGFVIIIYGCSFINSEADMKSVIVGVVIMLCGVAAILVSATCLLLISSSGRKYGSMDTFLMNLAIAGMALAFVGTLLPFSRSEGFEKSKWFLQLCALLVGAYATTCVLKRRKFMARILGVVGVVYIGLILLFTPKWIEQSGAVHFIKADMRIGYYSMGLGCAVVIVSAILLRYMTRDEYGPGRKGPSVDLSKADRK